MKINDISVKSQRLIQRVSKITYANNFIVDGNFQSTLSTLKISSNFRNFLTDLFSFTK